MVEYIEKGGLYDVEDDPEAREDLETIGVVARCNSWPEVETAVRVYLDLQAKGQLGGPPEHYKLRVWKSPVLLDFPWCLKWVEKVQDTDETVELPRFTAREDAP